MSTVGSEKLRGIADGFRDGAGRGPSPMVPRYVFMGSFHTLVGMALDVAPPAGDVVQVRSAGGRFRRIASRVEQIGLDLDRWRRNQLPQVREGEVLEAADRQMRATADRAEHGSQVLRTAFDTLDALATGLVDARHRYWPARRQLVDTAATLESLPEGQQRAEVSAYRIRCADIVDQMAGGLEHAENACLDAATTLNWCAGQATAGALDTNWLTITDRLLITGAADGAGPILTAADAQRATEQLAQLTPEERREFHALLDAAQSDAEMAWLLKGLAAGHNLSSLTDFAATVRGRDESWFEETLRPIVPGRTDFGKLTWMGTPVVQTTPYTCGSMGLLVMRASHDPLYALELAAGGPADEMPARLIGEEARILEETSGGRLDLLPHWPASLGTHPRRAAAYLDTHTGTDYHVSWDATNRGRGGTVDSVTGAIADASMGKPAMLVIGGRHYPRHFVVVMGVDADGNALVYNSWGQLEAVPPDRLHQEPVEIQAVSNRGYEEIYAVVVPRG